MDDFFIMFSISFDVVDLIHIFGLDFMGLLLAHAHSASSAHRFISDSNFFQRFPIRCKSVWIFRSRRLLGEYGHFFNHRLSRHALVLKADFLVLENEFERFVFRFQHGFKHG